MCTSVKSYEWVWRATARLQRLCDGEREPKQFKLNVLAACTATYILIKFVCYNSDDHVTWQAELQTKQCTVTRFASGKHLAWLFIHSMDSPASSWLVWAIVFWLDEIDAYVVTYMWAFKWKLLLAQAHPSIFLVVSNPVCIYLTCYKSNSLSAVQKTLYKSQWAAGMMSTTSNLPSEILVRFLYTSVKPPICLEVN